MKKTLLGILILFAIAGAISAQGMWRDGTYTAEADAFSNGWKNFVRIVVTNGYIVDAHFDGIPADGGKYKYLLSVDGEYGMAERGGAQASWYVQVDRAAAELLKTQDPRPLTRSGNADAISGVSITVVPHMQLAQQALAGARR